MHVFDHKPTPIFLVAQAFAMMTMYVIVKAALRFRDVEDTMAFYGVYHREPMNQLIHFFGVPGILWSILIIFSHLPLPWLGSYAIIVPGTAAHPITWAAVLALFYFIFYFYVDVYGASLFSPLLYYFYTTASNWTMHDQQLHIKKTSSKTGSWMGTGRMLRLGALIHIFCWYIQIHPGHAIFEGAKPALLDSVGGALTSAPLFAFYEGLWFAGINKRLQQRTQVLVEEYTAKLCAQGAMIRACAIPK
jgi:uncharacterized membrane protein YGL010W